MPQGPLVVTPPAHRSGRRAHLRAAASRLRPSAPLERDLARPLLATFLVVALVAIAVAIVAPRLIGLALGALVGNALWCAGSMTWARLAHPAITWRTARSLEELVAPSGEMRLLALLADPDGRERLWEWRAPAAGQDARPRHPRRSRALEVGRGAERLAARRDELAHQGWQSAGAADWVGRRWSEALARAGVPFAERNPLRLRIPDPELALRGAEPELDALLCGDEPVEVWSFTDPRRRPVWLLHLREGTGWHWDVSTGLERLLHAEVDARAVTRWPGLLALLVEGDCVTELRGDGVEGLGWSERRLLLGEILAGTDLRVPEPLAPGHLAAWRSAWRAGSRRLPGGRRAVVRRLTSPPGEGVWQLFG